MENGSIFDTPVERRGTGSIKWDVADGELPMWVADMDFPTAPPVRRAIERRAAHGVFGYTDVSGAWSDAYIGWWRDRHAFTMQREWLIFCTGVVPAISSIVRKLTTPAEKVLIQTPVYNIFFNSILNNGRVPIESPLVYEDGRYRIDFADLEQKLSDPQTTLMLLCDPHNPAGCLWTEEELAQIGALCARHHVTVVSDEIHCDLTDPGNEYVPFLSVSEECRRIGIACVAPTKAFGIPGIQTAAVVVPDPFLRHRVWRGLNTDEVAEPNAFAVDAAVAAFTEGGAWLDELRAYLAENKNEVRRYAAEHLPRLYVVPSVATYLLWLDCRAYTQDTDRLAADIRRRTGLYLSAGAQYGGNGRGFLRMNTACPRSVLRDGLARLSRGLDGYTE